MPGGELLNTEKIEDYPGFESVLGRDLAELMTDHARKFGADIRQENVEGISRRDRRDVRGGRPAGRSTTPRP